MSTFDESKIATLAYFAVTPGPLTAKQIGKSPLASTVDSIVAGPKCAPMRLLRYARQGLLVRKRRGREYEYEITTRGEERLLHLWRTKGLLDVGKANSEREKKALEVRLKIERYLLEKHKREADQKKSESF